MAAALGWGRRRVGWADVLALARDPRGWSGVGQPRFGAFRFGRTHPEASNSGLIALLAATYAVAGKSRVLLAQDVAKPAPSPTASVRPRWTCPSDLPSTARTGWTRSPRSAPARASKASTSCPSCCGPTWEASTSGEPASRCRCCALESRSPCRPSLLADAPRPLGRRQGPAWRRGLRHRPPQALRARGPRRARPLPVSRACRTPRTARSSPSGTGRACARAATSPQSTRPR